jgi:hypothetical protein
MCFDVDSGNKISQVSRFFVDHRKRAKVFGVTPATHSDEVRPRKDKRVVDLISDMLPFGGLSYGEPNAISNAIGYAKFYSR